MRFRSWTLGNACVMVLVAAAAYGQGTLADYQRAQSLKAECAETFRW